MTAKAEQQVQPFVLTAQHVQQYRDEGYTVFERIIPPPLLARLRAACEEARSLARSQNGPQTQRLQPVARPDLDQAAFVEYGELAPLRDAVRRLLAAPPQFGDRKVFGVLLEPRDRPYATNWHRDWRDNIEACDHDVWWGHLHDRACFNQINCALYDDDCLWVVPGSHRRGDTAAEVERFPSRPVRALRWRSSHVAAAEFSVGLARLHARRYRGQRLRRHRVTMNGIGRACNMQGACLGR